MGVQCIGIYLVQQGADQGLSATNIFSMWMRSGCVTRALLLAVHQAHFCLLVSVRSTTLYKLPTVVVPLQLWLQKLLESWPTAAGSTVLCCTFWVHDSQRTSLVGLNGKWLTGVVLGNKVCNSRPARFKKPTTKNAPHKIPYMHFFDTAISHPHVHHI